MPKYIIFLIIADRKEASESKDDDDIKKDPVFKKMLEKFLSWIKTEIEAERIKGGEYLLEASEETNVRIDFHNPSKEDLEKEYDGSTLPPQNSSVTRGHQKDASTNILAYYNAEFPTLDEAITWARSCPIAYGGFSLELRQLQHIGDSMNEAPSEVREWIGDHIVSVREHLAEEGKLKKEEDGTQWVKLEDEGGIKEIVAEAEERKAQKGEDKN